MNSFIHIKLLLSYLNEFEEQRNDMKMLGEYVIDNVFEHEGNGTNTHSFDKLSLKEIREWNELVAYGREIKNKLSEFGPMLSSMFAYRHNLPVGFTTRHDGYGYRCGLIYINETKGGYHIGSPGNWDEYWYDYFRHRMFPKEFMEKYGNKRDDIACNNFRGVHTIHNFISIPRIHEDEEYILYFINNDFNLNRLRIILIMLMKERMKLYSHELDEGKQITNELEYNELLIEYCRKLIISCKNYLEKQMKNSTILLTIE